MAFRDCSRRNNCLFLNDRNPVPFAPSWQRFSKYPPIMIPNTAPGIAIPPEKKDVRNFIRQFGEMIKRFAK